jgi:dTDP-4-dehydrorhamnose 3,5-epimerase
MSNICNDKYIDHRGVIYTVYDNRQTDIKFVQDKVTKSHKGVIRGFHGDNKTWKLITCLDGIIKLITYDVDKDIKQEYILDSNSEQSVSVLVPPRVLNAHQCLSETCIFYYKWSEYYTEPEHQWSVRYNDQNIQPNWDTSLSPIVSDRDNNSFSLNQLKQWINKN